MAAGMLLASLCAGVARGSERITLRNGFDLTCAHHETLGATVRLYLEPGNTSFVDVGKDEILSVDWVPDPPRPALQTVTPGHAAKSELTPADLRQLLVHEGAEQNLNVELLASVVRAESGGHARAVSRTGAQGLMQLMPKTAAGLGVHDSFEPGQNVHGGTAYLNSLLVKYHDNLALALAAYNAGPAAVERWHGIPPYRETRAYVARVIHQFNLAYAHRMERASHEDGAVGERASVTGSQGMSR